MGGVKIFHIHNLPLFLVHEQSIPINKNSPSPPPPTHRKLLICWPIHKRVNYFFVMSWLVQ
jgi:hypothetical protein